MKKWKAIRDCFVRDHRSTTAAGTGQAASKKKKYIFYDQLLFLLPHVKGERQIGLHSYRRLTCSPNKSGYYVIIVSAAFSGQKWNVWRVGSR
ncbi:uncharacterized protein LOC124369766 isoform X2 [Homalodisca vitripennis]|uniref:uncharacterized protein LOC124369766 isoform X2 n=1 Tax=Homalodisca vitripennis TaxID=197043 RepID=UPI001EECE2C8|nr:uncharacterized protein LOC124369766 isoform X2 [Homalodisca vitripennis]